MGVAPHTFNESEPDAVKGAQGGFFVPGYILAPTARGALSDDKSGLYSCPEHALRTWGADLLQMWRRTDGNLPDVPRLTDATPSAALWDAWDLLASGFASLRETLRKRAQAGAKR